MTDYRHSQQQPHSCAHSVHPSHRSQATVCTLASIHNHHSLLMAHKLPCGPRICAGNATLGRAELYRVSHDYAERVDLSRHERKRTAGMLRQLHLLLHDAVAHAPYVIGWSQRVPPCPRWNRHLNVSEQCCQPLSAADLSET